MPMLDKDLVQPSDLQSHSEGTGALRSQIPQYVDFLPPCNSACPAGENIQAWLGLAQAGHYAEAWQKLVEENPLTEYAYRELRYKDQQRSNPEEAKYLMQLAQEIVDLRWQNYENMAGWKAEAFQPVV